MGNKLKILRGPLLRESLKLQVIELESHAERMAWLAKYISNLDGSGIIYCLTIGDCNRVAMWLRENDIDALEYHSKLSSVNEKNSLLKIERENLLMTNKVKVLVSTIALGMGYDKPDLAFVIHFQRPGSLVAYYQQIGRAGRELENAIVVLLTGQEDDEIHDYFINSAFPTSHEMENVINSIEDSYDGLSKNEILLNLDISNGRLDKCLKKLVVNSLITKTNSKYSRTIHPFNRQDEKSSEIKELRYRELEEMKEFCTTNGCYMKFIAMSLDDPYAGICGKCANCVGHEIISSEIIKNMVGEAVTYLKSAKLTVKTRKMWPAKIIEEAGKKIPTMELNEEGRMLSIYGDAGWGKDVKKGKYTDHNFSDELVDATVKLYNAWEARDKVKWVTYVPSLRRPELVKSFAERVADKLGLPLKTVIEKIEGLPEQKTFHNSYHKCLNAYKSFEVDSDIMSEPVLLIDDMCYSGWTFTVCGSLLRKNGVEAVYPFALASTARQGG